MVKIPAPVAAAVSKAAMLEDLYPRLFGAALVLAAVLLIAAGLQAPDKKQAALYRSR